MSAIASLSQLTSLELELNALGLEFSTASSTSWTRLTALQSLTLHAGTVQAEAVAAFTQLRALRLEGVATPAGQQLEGLFGAVAQLSLLTELLVFASDDTSSRRVDPPPAAAFTSLTASTNLCSLQVGFVGRDADPGVLFRPGTVYPSLRLIHLRYRGPLVVPLSEQKLQQLCDCCPAVESLVFTLCENFSPTALQPLLQLSALTRLEVDPYHSFTVNVEDLRRQVAMQKDEKAAAATAAAAAAAAVGTGAGAVNVAAQLTGLKMLALEFKESPHLSDPVLLQLTALTALEQLRLRCYREHDYEQRRDNLLLQNKARSGRHPDVWTQLSSHLERSMTAAAAPASSVPIWLEALLMEQEAAAGPRASSGGSERGGRGRAGGSSITRPEAEALGALLALLRATAVSAEPPDASN